MWLLNKSVILTLLILCSSIGIAQNSDWSPILKGKVDKALTTLYASEKLSFETVEIDELTDEATPVELNEHLFKVFADGIFKGYAYVAQAPSMKNVFDYLVVFNTDLSIEKAKVLIYREQHGRQIGTARWLSQFKGMTTADRPELGKHVDGISGATISAKGMTNAINDLLSSLTFVKEKGII
tara:strand:+ start:88781 stop:89326 length:546 start_codon:yes stop_codon:yes gene_type:complete